MSYEEMRRAYRLGSLTEQDLAPDPLELFRTWMERATESAEIEPNAMALATVGTDGQPRVRFVLLKDATHEGFVFFTNYESRKGHDIDEVPRASVAFWWPLLERQVRADGAVSRLPPEASDAYFASRPYGSQIGAWASRQSEPVDGHDQLAREAALYRERFPEGSVPRPEHWGGYLLRPERMEFWQGRDDRLHDRFEYRLVEDGWRSQRLSP